MENQQKVECIPSHWEVRGRNVKLSNKSDSFQSHSIWKVASVKLLMRA
jgi:hypothetical protein